MLLTETHGNNIGVRGYKVIYDYSTINVYFFVVKTPSIRLLLLIPLNSFRKMVVLLRSNASLFISYRKT